LISTLDTGYLAATEMVMDGDAAVIPMEIRLEGEAGRQMRYS
jgi:hypothetical protein